MKQFSLILFSVLLCPILAPLGTSDSVWAFQEDQNFGRTISADQPQKPSMESDMPLVENLQSETPVQELKTIENTIQKVIDEYRQAFNKNDAESVAKLWTVSGKCCSAQGKCLNNCGHVKTGLAQLFEKIPGIQMNILESEINVISPTLAIEEGKAELILPNGEKTESSYLAYFVPENGVWKIDLVQNIPSTEKTPAHQALNQLVWMIGAWKTADEMNDIRMVLDWNASGNYLIGYFDISPKNSDQNYTGFQIIGWNPVSQLIESSVFNSDGSSGNAVWENEDSTWFVTTRMILSDGRTASCTNSFRPVSPSEYLWSSTNRVLNGQSLPDIPETKIIRMTGEEIPLDGTPGNLPVDAVLSE